MKTSRLFGNRVGGVNIGTLVAALVLAAVVAVLISVFFRPTTNSVAKATETAYDSIIRTGKIRCGYVSNPPSCVKDPNTGKLSGIFVEAIEQAAKNLDLQVEWTEEVGFGSMIEGIERGRYDIVPCARKARFAFATSRPSRDRKINGDAQDRHQSLSIPLRLRTFASLR